MEEAKEPTLQEQINANETEILELIALIQNWDYLNQKEDDGSDMNQYPPDWKEQRKKWRADINKLESEIEQLKIQLETEQLEQPI